MATTEQSTVGGVSFALTDEQKELRSLAREFAANEIRPVAAEHDVGHAPPGRSDREGARARPDERPRAGRVRRPRPERVRRDARRRGAQLGLLGHRHVARRERARRRPRDHRRHRRAEGGLAPAAPRRTDPLLVRALRARRGLGRRADEDDRGAQGRRVRAQRVEDVHHERRLRGLDRRLREDRPGEGPSRHLGVHRPDGHAGRDDRAAPRQDGAARDRHVRVRAPGRRHPGREPPRRGGAGLQDRDADARLHAARARRSARSGSRRPPTSSPSSTRRSASRSTCRSRCTRASTS